MRVRKRFELGKIRNIGLNLVILTIFWSFGAVEVAVYFGKCSIRDV